MSTARDHSRFDELAVGWALYALEPDDEQVLAAHLPSCERCRRIVRESEETLATVAIGLSGPEPSPRLLDRIHEAIGAPVTGSTPVEPTSPAAAVPAAESAATEIQPAEIRPAEPQPAEEQQPSTGHLPSVRRTGAKAPSAPARHRRGPTAGRPAGRAPAGRSRARRLSQLAAALVLVIAVAVGSGWIVNARNAEQHQQQMAAQRRTMVEKLIKDSRVATLTSQHGKQVGYVVNQNGKLAVVSDGMPANDRSSSIYALWSVSGTRGTPQLVGVFDVKDADLGVQPVASVPAGMSGVTTMAVSKEPGRGTPTRPTDIVASGAVNS